MSSMDVPKKCLPVILGFILLLIGGNPVGAELKKLGDNSMRGVSGQEGLAFRLNDWRIDGGNTVLDINDPDGENFTIGKLRVTDPEGIGNPGGISNNRGECTNSGPCESGDGGRLLSGTFNDPFGINLTDAGNGRISLNFPGNESSFEAADILLKIGMNYDSLGTAVIGNALWHGGTRLVAGIRPKGGINLGIKLQLNGDIWYTTDDVSMSNADADNGIYAKGVYAGSYFRSWDANCDVDSASFNEDCFSGALTWASIQNNRPLKVDFADEGGRDFRFERIDAGSGGQGTIGVQELNYDGFSLGETIIDDVNIQHFQLDGPT